MGNNQVIRKRMETYRTVLLAVVWIAGVAEMIGGLVMINDRYLKPFGIALLIVSILGSIIGHFLVNVCLAIPFILLNNGDNLESMISLLCKNGKIVLKRISSNKDSDKSMDISIDEKQKIHLLNGEEKTIDLEGGYHKIVSVYKPTPQKTVKENDTVPNYNELLFPKKVEAKFTINDDVKNINISIEPEFKIEIV